MSKCSKMGWNERENLKNAQTSTKLNPRLQTLASLMPSHSAHMQARPQLPLLERYSSASAPGYDGQRQARIEFYLAWRKISATKNCYSTITTNKFKPRRKAERNNEENPKTDSGHSKTYKRNNNPIRLSITRHAAATAHNKNLDDNGLMVQLRPRPVLRLSCSMTWSPCSVHHNLTFFALFPVVVMSWRWLCREERKENRNERENWAVIPSTFNNLGAFVSHYAL